MQEPTYSIFKNKQWIFCMAMKLFSSTKFRLFLKVKSKLKRPGCSNLVDNFAQGYYNTGWFNSKIRSRANLLICQQTNIKAKLKCLSDKVTYFRIELTLYSRNLDNKLSYEKITLAGMGVEVNHETLISNSKK